MEKIFWMIVTALISWYYGNRALKLSGKDEFDKTQWSSFYCGAFLAIALHHLMSLILLHG